MTAHLVDESIKGDWNFFLRMKDAYRHICFREIKGQDKFDTKDEKVDVKREKHLLNRDLDVCYWSPLDQTN